MTRVAEQTRPPKGVQRLTDVEHARALHAFCLADGDLSKTHVALKKRVSMKTLSWYCGHRKWELLFEEMKSDLVREATQDAKTQRLADLHMLAIAKERSAFFISKGVRPKTLGEAVNALVSTIRLEREILGPGQATPEDALGVLKFVADAVRAATKREEVSADAPSNGGNGDTARDGLDDDPFGLRKDVGSQ